jgi:hypothetical protein
MHFLQQLLGLESRPVILNMAPDQSIADWMPAKCSLSAVAHHT